jgi:hypothetical protein
MKYRPKGSMCMTCSKVANNCHLLDFSAMKATKVDAGETVVICSDYLKYKKADK